MLSSRPTNNLISSNGQVEHGACSVDHAEKERGEDQQLVELQSELTKLKAEFAIMRKRAEDAEADAQRANERAAKVWPCIC
jgi:hypothetical protein